VGGWSSYPFCPLKADGMKVAFLFAEDDGKPILHIGNICEVWFEGKSVESFPIKEYHSFEAIQQDGWRVD
jgi:hypothetical protein